MDNKLYILKVIKFQHMQDDEIQLSRKEPIIMKDLHHEHVLQLVDYFEENNQMNMIYEKYETSLMDRIYDLQKNNLIMPEEEKWRYLIQIAYCLRYLSNKRIVHRMLHTKKILLDKNGKVKVTNLQWSCPVGDK